MIRLRGRCEKKKKFKESCNFVDFLACFFVDLGIFFDDLFSTMSSKKPCLKNILIGGFVTSSFDWKWSAETFCFFSGGKKIFEKKKTHFFENTNFHTFSAPIPLFQPRGHEKQNEKIYLSIIFSQKTLFFF